MTTMLNAMLWLFLFDVLFIGLAIGVLIPLVVWRPAAYAVLKRNFVGYFSNPTGYVFLCLFVLLTSFAAFWPHAFFTANLANLDQLNVYLPWIMLIFIPAITMSIWAEERRQGTDELLLTLPATDFDIVIGKYLAAASIYSCSLLFSQISNYMVLVSLTLGDVDTGLLFATYFGYWLAGLGMLAVGMVASFLTKNLTVGFILGAAFNAPLAFLAYSDSFIPVHSWAQTVYAWSTSAQLDDFGRGVLSLKSTVYFVMIMVFGIYVSMVLIGRRHWTGGKDGNSMLGHYLLRSCALLVIVLGVTIFFTNHDWIRRDITRDRTASLSRETRQLVRDLNPKYPIYIDAFVGAQVPEAYVQTKRDLISKLREFQSLSGAEIVVRLHNDLESFSEDAVLAEERYNITPQVVRTRSRGAIQDEEVILGAAFSCGLEQVVVPFFDYGVSVEYELVRSLATVASAKRAKLGIVRTDAQLFGGFSFAGGQPRQIPRQAIVVELEKQYDVEEVDPTNPIDTQKYDVMMVVQPSSLGPAELDNVIAAIQAGVPTAVFEDPRPIFLTSAPATGEPKQAPGGGGMFGMGGGGQRSPKGDIQKLWNVLGISVPGEPGMMGGFEPELAWQEYLPYLKLQIEGIPDQWIFASNDSPGENEALNSQSPITSGLDEVFLPVPGVIKPARGSDLEFTKLVSTGEFAGTMKFRDFMQNQNNGYMLRALRGRPQGEQILAARITGKVAEDQKMSDVDSDGATDADAAAPKKKIRPIDVVYVADIDLMISTFMRIRARPDEDEEIRWRFENVTFLLNIVDSLSGDDAYVPIRKRKSRHSTLEMVELRSQDARQQEAEKRIEFQEGFDKAIKDAEDENKKIIEKFQTKVDKLQERQKVGEEFNPADLAAALTELQIQQQRLDRKLALARTRLERERDQKIKRIRRDVDLKIRRIQNEYKFWAVLLPPIPPLFVGLIFWVRRALKEREGISRSRLRIGK